MRSFASWLDGCTSPSDTRLALCFRICQLSVTVKSHREDTDSLQLLTQNGQGILGNLLSLGSVESLDFTLPPGLLSSVYDSLPSLPRTLHTLGLGLDACDASAAQALTDVIPNFRLDNLLLCLKRTSSAPDPTTLPLVLRTCLDGERSLIPSL